MRAQGYRSLYNRVFKRWLDVALALPFSIVLTPVIALTGAAGAVEGGVPVVYTPLRGGYRG